MLYFCYNRQSKTPTTLSCPESAITTVMDPKALSDSSSNDAALPGPPPLPPVTPAPQADEQKGEIEKPQAVVKTQAITAREVETDANPTATKVKPNEISDISRGVKRPAKRIAPFTLFVPKNVQENKRSRLSPSFLQATAPTEKATKSEKSNKVTPSSTDAVASQQPVEKENVSSPDKKVEGSTSSAAQSSHPQTHENRVKQVPVEDIFGPSSDSVDMYADFLGAMNSSHPSKSTAARADIGTHFARSSSLLGNFCNDASTSDTFHARKLREQLPAKTFALPAKSKNELPVDKLAARHARDWSLVQTLTVESKEANALDWTEDLWSPASIASGIRHAVRCSTNEDCGIFARLTYFEHPAPGPSAPELQKMQGPNSAQYKLHGQQRVDGSSDAPNEIGLGEKSRSATNMGQDASAAAGQPQDRFMTSSARGGRRDEVNGPFVGGPNTGEGNYLFDRRCTWGAAFKSLMTQLEQGDCPYFYFIDTENGHVGLFLGKGQLCESKDSPPCAMLSRSSASLRSQLSRCQVPFECPLDSSLERTVSTIDPDLQDELRAYSRSATASRGVSATTNTQLARSSSMGGLDDESRSLLGFVGSSAVHGLYNVLLNRVVRRGGLHECPQLVSPVPFLYASCQSPPVSVPRLVRSTQDKKLVEMEVISLQSPMLTAQFGNVLATLAKEHARESGAKDPSLTVKLNSNPGTRFFNEALRKMSVKNKLGLGRIESFLDKQLDIKIDAVTGAATVSS